MTRDEAKEKIKKLLALANRPGTPAEGEVALAKAKSLAEVFGFSIVKGAKEKAEHQPRQQQRREYPEWYARFVAKHGIRKAVTEWRRRESMRWTAYWDGYDMGMHPWSTPDDCPYERSTVWGVPIKAEWLRGFEHAKQGDGGRF